MSIPMSDWMGPVEDTHIKAVSPVIPPAILIEEYPLSETSARMVAATRNEVVQILSGHDDRLLVNLGPCAIHDVYAAVEYAERLQAIAKELKGDLRVVMRCHFEQPTSQTYDWKGLVYDPNLDGSFNINRGLTLARLLLLRVVELGLPTGVEFQDVIVPQFLADLVTVASIGSRIVESQPHRELVSGLPTPTGFKNPRGGEVAIAIDAMKTAHHPHHFLSMTKQGMAAIMRTRGNPNAFLILRGGFIYTNYDAPSVAKAVEMLVARSLSPRLVVDCSHGNSLHDYRNQPKVAESVGAQIANGDRNICGVMLESFLVEDRQDLRPGAELTYGQSITDGCVGWSTTESILRMLAEAVRRRRCVRR